MKAPIVTMANNEEMFIEQMCVPIAAKHFLHPPSLNWPPEQGSILSHMLWLAAPLRKSDIYSSAHRNGNHRALKSSASARDPGKSPHHRHDRSNSSIKNRQGSTHEHVEWKVRRRSIHEGMVMLPRRRRSEEHDPTSLEPGGQWMKQNTERARHPGNQT
mgnify:CR=1 FL=1